MCERPKLYVITNINEANLRQCDNYENTRIMQIVFIKKHLDMHYQTWHTQGNEVRSSSESVYFQQNPKEGLIEESS